MTFHSNTLVYRLHNDWNINMLIKNSAHKYVYMYVYSLVCLACFSVYSLRNKVKKKQALTSMVDT